MCIIRGPKNRLKWNEERLLRKVNMNMDFWPKREGRSGMSWPKSLKSFSLLYIHFHPLKCVPLTPSLLYFDQKYQYSTITFSIEWVWLKTDCNTDLFIKYQKPQKLSKHFPHGIKLHIYICGYIQSSKKTNLVQEPFLSYKILFLEISK